MVPQFSSLKDLIDYKLNCAFCHNKLIPILTNFTAISGGIPTLNCKYKNDFLNFDLKVSSAFINVDCQVNINCQNNEIKFSNNFADKSVEAFEFIRPHLEMYCSKRVCGLKYYLSSDSLQCEKKGDFSYWLKPPRLYFECFNVGKLWIQNDFQNNITNIFSNTTGLPIPIQMDMLELDTMNKDTVINKIKTQINFS